MKKFLLPFLVALFGAATSAVTAAPLTRADLVSRVETCEAILREFQASPATAVPASILRQAKAIVIVNQFKAGLFLGVKDGYGLIIVKQPTGSWSIPVLINAGEASIGLQFGAKAIETVMIITDDQTPRKIFSQRYNVGVDAKAVAGPKAAEAERDNHAIIDAPVLVYAKTKGLFAGATVKAGYLTRNDDANYKLYNTGYTMPELLYSNWVNVNSAAPEVLPLMQFVTQITQ